MKTVRSFFLTMLGVLLLVGCGSKKSKDVALAMTCDVINTGEYNTLVQDFYGSNDVLVRFVQKSSRIADDKAELKALEENIKENAASFKDLAGVKFDYKIKDLTIYETIEIDVEKAEVATLIKVGMIQNEEDKDISISKTKEILEASNLAKCKLIDNND